ncbi:MAG: VRR-NUC domain-containing protein [Thaumarchaeota archaeon]|nr:VRR-NUC domain-containing protein [Nitrososphaerota archaeon]
MKRVLQADGWDVYHRGLPDFFCVRGAEFKFVEVKFHKDRLSAFQKAVTNAMLRAGFKVDITSLSPSELKAMKSQPHSPPEDTPGARLMADLSILGFSENQATKARDAMLLVRKTDSVFWDGFSDKVARAAFAYIFAVLFHIPATQHQVAEYYGLANSTVAHAYRHVMGDHLDLIQEVYPSVNKESWTFVIRTRTRGQKRRNKILQAPMTT